LKRKPRTAAGSGQKGRHLVPAAAGLARIDHMSFVRSVGRPNRELGDLAGLAAEGGRQQIDSAEAVDMGTQRLEVALESGTLSTASRQVRQDRNRQTEAFH